MTEIYLSELSKINLEWKKSSYRPKASDWPDSIFLTDQVLKELKYLESYTKEKTFGIMSIREGSTGWEYSETAVYLGGELFFSKPKAGDYNSVVPELKISKPVLKPEKDNISIKFNIGDKAISTVLKRNVLEEDNNFGPVLVVHTHPKSRVADNREIYTFFSAPDLKFLHKNPIYMLGMVSKNTLWLVCETDQFNSIDVNLLHGATLAELEGGDEAIKNYIVENMGSSGLIFYHGTFGSKLKRIEYQKYAVKSKPIVSSPKEFTEDKPLNNDLPQIGKLKRVSSKRKNLEAAFIVIVFLLMAASLIILLKIIGIL